MGLAIARGLRRHPLRVLLVGHLGYSSPRIGGQIIRTRITLAELETRLGQDRVHYIDTGNIKIHPIGTLLRLRREFSLSSDVIVMPGPRALQFLMRMYTHWGRHYETNIHFLAIGGWLPDLLRRHTRLLRHLSLCNAVYVQTRRMVLELQSMGLDNVQLLPNYRRFEVDRPVSKGIHEPFRLVFMSRMIREKGVELAAQAVQELNTEYGELRVTLDIWGPVQDGNDQWFDRFRSSLRAGVRYRGVLPPDSVNSVLPNYDCMVFPTYYSGEAFPGVVVDAYVAGIPVIASDWHDNREVIEDGETGVIVPAKDLNNLKKAIRCLLESPTAVARMKQSAAKKALEYHVDRVVPQLLTQMGLTQCQDRRR